MADQQFCLRWNEHTGTMVKVFKQMLDSQSFVDCTLACEGKLIKAHKMILAACSPYLHTILEENTSKHPIIFLPHLKYTDIRALVDYMYCGEVYISFGHLPSLLKAAEVLRIKGLTDVTNNNGNNGGNAGNSNGNNNNNGGNANGTNISSSSDHLHHHHHHHNQHHNHHNQSSSGDTSGTSSASNLIEQVCDQTTQQQLGANAAVAAVAAAAAGHNLGQLLGNNLSNLLGATNQNNHLDNGDCGSEPGNINNNNNNNLSNKSTSALLEQSYEDEENEYDLGSHLTLDPEVSFVDDCSNEDANNEDESTNGESHNKTFLCHLCRCSFTAQSSLRRHMHRHYTDRERFECEICHNSYSRKDYLKEHKKTKHQIST